MADPLQLSSFAFLVGAGLVGGIVNALAGGATLLTFPAMLAAGLPPVTANASSAVALAPGQVVAALADRPAMPEPSRGLWLTLGAALVGGGLGAGLLLVTPETVFILIVPLLVASGTLLYAFSTRIEAAVADLSDGPLRRYRPALVFPATVYGGYFGAGLGVILLAAVRMTGGTTVRRNTALKNLAASAARVVAVLIFITAGSLDWTATLMVMAGALAGGFAGGRMIRMLPAAVVYWTVTGIGAATTLVYAWKYWA